MNKLSLAAVFEGTPGRIDLKEIRSLYLDPAKFSYASKAVRCAAVTSTASKDVAKFRCPRFLDTRS